LAEAVRRLIANSWQSLWTAG